MGFNDFWINNNGKKEQLNNAKHGVRKEQMDKKFHNLFDAYDANGDGTLETEELEGLFTGLTKFSGGDKTLDVTENKQVASLFANQVGIKDADFMGFVKSVSDATEEIVSSSTSKGVDGGNVITTTYKNGMVETIYYYPDGEFKLKTQKQDSVTESTTYVYTNDGKNYKQCSQAELDKMVKDGYKKQRAAEQRSDSTRITFEDGYRINFMKSHNVMPQTNKHEIHIDNTDMSDSAKAEAEIRDFVISHYVQTHKDCQVALDTMGVLDDIGAAINAGAGELWNSCKNIYNKHFGDGTESDYQNFYELVKKFEPNYDKAIAAESRLESLREHPAGYFTGEAANIDTEKGLVFQQTTEQYQNAQILKSRIDILNKAMLEISMYESEQNAITYAPVQSEGMNPASHILKANNLLLQYFDGDKEAVNMLLNGTIGNAQSTINAIKGIADDTQKMFDSVTNGKSFDEIKNDYQTQYKAIYGTDFVPDELTEKVMDAKATGGMVKLAAITAISILITKSPVMAEISAAAGGAEVTGAAANMIRTLATRYGASAVQQGIKFAMSSGTLATDVGLTLLNQVTSERGVNGEELWESAKGSAKYIYFGAYIGAPLAQAVSKQLGKIGATARLFEGGVKSANGAIQTTSITGEKLVQNLMKGGNKVLTTGGAFLTDVAAFSALEVATEGMDPVTAGKEQTEMLGKLKIMNHFIEYMLGGKVHAGMAKTQMDAAIERSGVKNWNIKEIKTPNKTVYEVEVGEGLPKVRFEDKTQLATAMLERITASYSGTIKTKTTETNSEPKVEGEELPSKIVTDNYPTVKKNEVKSEKIESDKTLGTKEKIQTSLEPRIKIEYKDGKTEKEILIDKVDNMIENILSRVDTSGYNTQKLKGIDLIEELCWDNLDLKLTPEEKELMKTIIIKQSYGLLTADKISDKDGAILSRFFDSYKKMTEPNNDILWVLRCLQDNNHLSNEQFNPFEVYQTCYKDNAFKKLTNEEINIVGKILTEEKGSINEQIERAKFDYSEIAKRGLVNLVKNKLGFEYDNAINYYKEFLFCTREELEAKIQRLNERPELIDNIKNLKFKTWQTLLNMPIEEYKRITTPIENREKVTLDTDSYRKELKSELEKPQPYDIQEALEVSRKDNLRLPFGGKTYKANKFIPFEPLDKVQSEEVLETLPTTKESMTQLEQNGKVQIDIKDKGGLNPTRAEEPVIHPEDISRLGQIESSEITVRYCAKTNWSNSKIARDIMQNFYDGNGHTLEGVNIEITQTSDGKYLIKISGEGHYDYERLDAIGNSSKNGDSSNAGGWGEGTRIVAGNLLSRLDTPYVKYACGDWEMKFGRSSDDVQTADMTQVLNKNNEKVKGNYIEFETADKELVQEILNSKDFFYQPYNKDFQNFDYENEFFGFKLLQNKDEKGNVYVVQRYETQDGIENSLDNLTLVFKKMPDDAELTKANNGQELKLETGRDRISLSNQKINELISRYLKTVPDKELMQTLATMKNSWIVGKEKTSNKMLLPLIEEAKRRGLGFEFKEKDAAQEHFLRALGLSEKFMAVPAFNSPADTEVIRLMGYTPVIHELAGMGIPEFARPQDQNQKQPAVPTQRELQKLRLVSEAVSTIKDNLELENFEHISDKEAHAPTIICDKASSPNEAAEAILNSEGLKGEWMTRAHLECERFTTLLSTKLHEITHKYGGDLSPSFSDALVDLQSSIMKGLVHNPESLGKLRILEEVFNEVDGKSVVENYIVDKKFNVSNFKKDIEKILSKPLDYVEYKEEENNGNSKNIGLRYDSDGGIILGSLMPKKTSLRTKITNLFKSNKSDNNTELSTSSTKKYQFESFEKSEQVPLERTLLSTTEALVTLDNTGTVEISIPNRGGMNPTKSENPIIHTDDISNLDKTQKSKIMIRYCAKTNWSDFKIARDIMQNFYDGNGHTLEGVDIKIDKEPDGTYKVKISGKGLYDYSHLKKIGDSTKDDDFSNAGGWGEGTRIVAGNLLSHLDTPYVKYACGDWEMNFGRSSDDIQTARMTQTLHKNSSPLKGNYIEFKTGNEKLIQEIINSKDFFYHPENSDFHNMLFENEFFGIKVLENPDDQGNFYLVQKYETENPDQDMKGISIVLKKSDKDPGIKAAQNGHLMIRRASVETGRDRVSISNFQAKELGRTYGMTMNEQDLVHTISSLKDFYVLNVGSMLGKELENGAILNNTEINFICGLVNAASAKHIQIDLKDLKITTVSEYDLKYDQDLVSDLLSRGYQFVPAMFCEIGIPTIKEAYKNEHRIKSLEPTKVENQKLQLLNEAIQLFAKNDNQGTIPDITPEKLYVFDASAQKHENIHTVVNGKQLSGLFVDKQYLENAEFLDCVTRMIASSLHVHGNSISAKYSYELTDLITSEVNTLMHNPEIAQKLQILKEKYDLLK